MMRTLCNSLTSRRRFSISFNNTTLNLNCHLCTSYAKTSKWKRKLSSILTSSHTISELWLKRIMSTALWERRLKHSTRIMTNIKAVVNTSLHIKTESTDTIESVITHLHSISSMMTVLHFLFKTKDRAAIKRILILKVLLAHWLSNEWEISCLMSHSRLNKTDLKVREKKEESNAISWLLSQNQKSQVSIMTVTNSMSLKTMMITQKSTIHSLNYNLFQTQLTSYHTRMNVSKSSCLLWKIISCLTCLNHI